MKVAILTRDTHAYFDISYVCTRMEAHYVYGMGNLALDQTCKKILLHLKQRLFEVCMALK